NGRRVPRDFVARNAVEVRVVPVERTGEVLDLVVQAGATAVDDVRFDVSDRAALEREALRLAVVDARARADAAAAGAGRAVDRVLRIDDIRQPDYRGPMMLSARAAPAEMATPAVPGLLEIRESVTLTVAIK
ncbi:MAG: SIMPL domain-containing protein, partial [Vicinamibacterales bacterium]